MNAKAAALLLPILLGIFAASASADSARVTLGDAMAIFEGIGGGGATMLHSGTLEGAPDDAPLARIRVFGASNGHHFCSLDWHVVGTQLGEIGPRQAAAAEIDGLQVAVTLDGAPLILSTTAVKRWDPQSSLLLFGSAEAYFRGYAAIMSPDALAVGTHSASIVVFDPLTGELDTGGVTFFVDPPGTGACA